MADEATERVHVDSPPDRVYEIATAYERYPDWAKDVKQVDILERDEEGRARRVEYRMAAMGRSIRVVFEYDYALAPDSFSWHLVEGDMLKRLDGTYDFDSDDGGTRVTYSLTVEVGVPLPGFMKRRAAGLVMGNALKELKREAEAGAGP
jgi:ribosome-associated toxin RatA of RatAB toxin-antitoxin module